MADPTGNERWARLEHAYGSEWRARVQALAPDFQQIVVAAAGARIDEWSEEYWYVLSRNADNALFHVPPDGHEPYADAPNRFEQGVRVLKREMLWPWQLLPRTTDATDEPTTEELEDRG